jgi:acyl carrier protein
MSDSERVCAIVARYFGRDNVTPRTRLIEDLAAESLDYVTIATALEKAFGYAIPDPDLYEVDTVEDLARLIQKGRTGKG